MRFRFEHLADLDAGKLVDKLAAKGFQGAVHRIDGPEAEKAVLIDVMAEVRSEDLYKVVREVAQAEGLVPHEDRPEVDEIHCRKRA